MTYDFKQEAEKMAVTLKISNQDSIDYLATCLELAYRDGEVSQMREMVKHIGDK